MGWTYQREYIRCGKARCKKCPHGPYWYGYEHRQGRMKKRYFGKKHPADQVEREQPAPHRFDDVFERSKCTEKLCREILGVSANASSQECKKAYYKASKEHHPDQGGDALVFKRLTCAWSYLRSLHGWK